MPEPHNPLPEGSVPPLALFLDFDGTLVDLAPAPDAIEVPADLITEITTAREAFGGAVALVSGRPIADLDRYLPLGLPAAGGHGSERRRADGALDAANADNGAAAERIAASIAEFVADHQGLMLEKKSAGVALHYRNAPELRDESLTRMRAIAESEGFGVIDGKMVAEARPGNLNKGEAVRAFMAEAPFSGRLPVFIGDDTTDEDGFATAQELGGIGVKVGDGKTSARLRTPDVESVRAIIRGLVERYGTSQTAEKAL